MLSSKTSLEREFHQLEQLYHPGCREQVCRRTLRGFVDGFAVRITMLRGRITSASRRGYPPEEV